MESGYSISELVQQAHTRWLKPAEVLFILQNHENSQITDQPPQKPASGSLFLFNKRVLRFFRKDGHSWRKKKDGRSVGEAHERLKVGNVEALNCYYAHGDQNPNFQRRSYWMLDPAHSNIVIVHYRDVSEGRQRAGFLSQFSPVSSTFSRSHSAYSAQQPNSPVVNGISYEQHQWQSSPASLEINSEVVAKQLDTIEITEEANIASDLDMNETLKMIEEYCSIDDELDITKDPFYSENESLNVLEDRLPNQSSPAQDQDETTNLFLQQLTGDSIEDHEMPLGHEANIWNEVQDYFRISQDTLPQVKNVQKLDENDMLLTSLTREPVEEQETYDLLCFGGEAAEIIHTEDEDPRYPLYEPYHDLRSLPDQGLIGLSLEDDMGLTIAQRQKFKIREISPEWGYADEGTKVVIVGSFVCDPLECVWTCMFGEIEVPVQVIQDGVIYCQAPPRLPGKVTLCITSGNRESCSEVKEFEYRVRPNVFVHNNLPEAAGTRSADELRLLVEFTQILLSDSAVNKVDGLKSGSDLLVKVKADDDSWRQVIDALFAGTPTTLVTMEWLLQELLKDKLQQWLSSRSREENNQLSYILSKKEKGIIHMVAGLGYEWALHPILNAGVGVDFRDCNSWTALHWAARFGREKMVAALIASRASAGAVTDPNAQDPVGKSPAAIAAEHGHKGLAGYLSEVALTSHLLSLTLEETELSRGSADVEAERTVSSIPSTDLTTSEDLLSLKDTLAAVRNAAQAAARIQSAFRAHSFRKRLQREAASADSGIDFGISSNDIQRISAASKFAFRSPRDYNSAALSIQKKYRGWKGRKDFLALKQKVVKIQAHIRGYQVRKYYRVCWAVGILDKAILRWRRGGVGLRGFRPERELNDEIEDEDILKVFRKQKVDAVLAEAVSRVLSMVESPEARQQYRRILEKYRQAKAKLDAIASKESSVSGGDDFNMEKDSTTCINSFGCNF